MRLPRRKLPAAMACTLIPFLGAACDGDEESLGLEEGVEIDDVAQTGVIADDEFGIYEAGELRGVGEGSLPGRTVVVSAEINRMIEEDAAFVMGEDVVEGGLLVVTPPRLDDEPALAEGVAVQVLGRVVEFDRVQIEEAYNPFELDEDAHADWEDKVALISQAVSFVPIEGSGQGAQGASLRPLNASGAVGTVPSKPKVRASK